MSYSTTWNTTYEGLPPDSELEALGAGRIRDLKLQIRLRMQADHSWIGDNNDGKHLKVTLPALVGPPTVLSNEGCLFTLSVAEPAGTFAELVYVNNFGTTTQLTFQGVQRFRLPLGTVIPWPGTSYGSLEYGLIPADGRAISRTTYAGLFSILGTSFGAGNGTTTFNVPSVLNPSGWPLPTQLIMAGP